jgi:hypothetical protein
MLTAILKAVKMLLSCCPKNSQDAVVLTALKAVQDAEKNYPYKDQIQRLIPIILMDVVAAVDWNLLCDASWYRLLLYRLWMKQHNHFYQI